MAQKFAQDTEVPVERSRAEIERMLIKFGATRFGSQWDKQEATIAFEAQGARVRFRVPLPSADADEFRMRRAGGLSTKMIERSDQERLSLRDREERRRWRCLALVIKAKIEAVESKVSTFTDEFMAHLILPNGETVTEWLKPQLAGQSHDMPPMLPAPKGSHK